MIKLFKQLKKNQAGFSLMEVLVASSIFVIISLSSLAIYSSVLKTSQKTIALTRVQQETQLIMQVLAKKIRTAIVDYTYYENNSPENDGKVNVLVLKDLVGDIFYFKKIDDGLMVAVNTSFPENDDDYKKIPATNVAIDDLDFYINPIENPFDIDNPPTSQPYVMMVLKVSSTKAGQSASLNLQQTIPQRSGVVE